MLKNEDLTVRIIEAAIEPHKELGPGLLEGVYEGCLCRELADRNLPFELQKELPILYKGSELDAGFRLDIVVQGEVIIELKSVESLSRLHEAQLLTYMKLSGIGIGLLINFNVELLKNGIRRFVL